MVVSLRDSLGCAPSCLERRHRAKAWPVQTRARRGQLEHLSIPTSFTRTPSSPSTTPEARPADGYRKRIVAAKANARPIQAELIPLWLTWVNAAGPARRWIVGDGTQSAAPATWRRKSNEGLRRVRVEAPSRARLGIGHIAAYSPQARGRSERAFATPRDRLPKKLALAGTATVEAPNRWLAEAYIGEHNKAFAVEPEQEGSGFVADRAGPRREILRVQDERTVGNDNAEIAA
jgi:hypothetical protein